MTGWIEEVHIRGALGPWSMICFCDYRLDVALDYEIDITGKYSGSYFLEEIKGLADATGLDYKVYKYVCIVFYLSLTCIQTFVVMYTENSEDSYAGGVDVSISVIP